jgi:hypothetical protein
MPTPLDLDIGIIIVVEELVGAQGEINDRLLGSLK